MYCPGAEPGLRLVLMRLLVAEGRAGDMSISCTLAALGGLVKACARSAPPLGVPFAYSPVVNVQQHLSVVVLYITKAMLEVLHLMHTGAFH